MYLKSNFEYSVSHYVASIFELKQNRGSRNITFQLDLLKDGRELASSNVRAKQKKKFLLNVCLCNLRALSSQFEIILFFFFTILRLICLYNSNMTVANH